ncbi:MAG: hypothetical protein K0Q43_9 [Ramlibacter sp.]|jgi:hypothetical protein|nr:hypothetical protein [Ramlibacter sp.]
MKGLLQAIFGPKDPPKPPATVSTDAPPIVPGEPVSFTGDANYLQNSDILDGLRFNATLKVTTPLAVLRRHGERFDGPPSQAPAYGDMSQGIWMAQTTTWKSMGIDLPEFGAVSTHASDVGPVNPDDYLPFLIEFRTIFESEATDEIKLEQLAELGKKEPYRAHWKTLRANRDFPLSLFFYPLCKLDGVGRVTARSLYEAGFRSKSQVLASTPQELSTVRGIGLALAARILATKAE